MCVSVCLVCVLYAKNDNPSTVTVPIYFDGLTQHLDKRILRYGHTCDPTQWSSRGHLKSLTQIVKICTTGHSEFDGFSWDLGKRILDAMQ